ncbi:Rrf2 family transcriptional regulator [Blastopirellula sp. JC732]|uniref:Rrf2 family transcriptional regulator n=1 Tax=Blastopirellula sediminis TaxID=2894196 RepID=A0A9X1SLW5_9BACT|nr:Rrf2 family transcriptional regulator [Blastopirellula sediminis]MCC9605561.1 Rrf2 family transcriptional regulator [Blastopirellula sediminis]MCC9631139.1 Rrf2 family transcriptional regulator [Blastopirellula sediminis]
MKLTTQTDYALRTLMFLARRGERANVADVAQLFDISVHHVAKVVNLLAKYGYVRSVRGVGGGIELARKPETISIGEIIERFEGSMHLLDCIDTDEEVCAIQSFCKLKGVLAEAERVQRSYLDGVTLADVVPGARQLVAFGARR